MTENNRSNKTNHRRKVSQVKRAQIIASLLTGESCATVAREHAVSTRTVQRFKRALTRDQQRRIENARVENKQHQESEISRLVKQHLTGNLEAGRNLANATKDANWLSQQSAGDLAILYGVLADKAFRILEVTEQD